MSTSKEGRAGAISDQNGGHGLFEILLPELSMSGSERLRQSSASDVIYSLLHSLTLIHMVSGEGSGIHLYSLNKNEGDPGTSIDQQHDAWRKSPYLGQWSL